MAQENTISISFTEAEIFEIKNAITQLATLLNGKAKNLTPNERQTFGRI